MCILLVGAGYINKNARVNLLKPRMNLSKSGMNLFKPGKTTQTCYNLTNNMLILKKFVGFKIHFQSTSRMTN